MITAALDEAARGADLLHLHSNGLIIEVAAVWAARRGVPYVLTLYGTEIWHYRRRWPVDPFTRAYHGARRVTFYSRKLLERAQELGLGSARASPSCIPRSARRSSRSMRDARARVRARPRHHRAAPGAEREAAPRAGRPALPHRRIRARVARPVRSPAGPLWRRTAARRRSRSRRAAPASTARVTFAGLVDNDTVARYAAAADVFVLPSLLEALPTVAVEALACRHAGPLGRPSRADSSCTSCWATTCRSCRRPMSMRWPAALSDALARPARVRPRDAGLVDRHFGRAARRERLRRRLRRPRGPGPVPVRLDATREWKTSDWPLRASSASRCSARCWPTARCRCCSVPVGARDRVPRRSSAPHRSRLSRRRTDTQTD